MVDDSKVEKRDSYESLSRSQLIALLRRQENAKKLGLVWERDAIAADRALNESFASAELILDQCERPAPWDNLVIEGDNYDALRWLRMTHRGRVKCIYIDPPYNTGNKDWVYNDSYVDKTDRYRHSTWLEFLYRRLTLARDLLTEDGVILISINDENRARLELMADEALPGMKVGSFVWRTRTGGNEGGDHFFSTNQEHILIYGSASFKFGGTEKTFEKYSNPDSDLRGDWRDDNLTVSVAYNDKRAGKAYYPLHDPISNIWYPCNPDRVWAYVSKEHSPNARIKTKFMEEFIADGQVIFPDDQEVVTWSNIEALRSAVADGNVPRSRQTMFITPELPNFEFWINKKVGFGTPRFKRFKKDLRHSHQPISSWITPNAESETVNADVDEFNIISGTNDEATKAIKRIFGVKAFNYAKPVSLIRELVRQSTSPGDLVFDFFAGSATTAQAVMELNAEDGGDRRFIMVSSTEATEDEPDKNICRDVTSERIRRLNANDDKYAELSAGFAYLRMKAQKTLLIDDALTPATVWTALEAMHQLPLTAWDGGSHAIHSGEHVTLALVDQLKDGFTDQLAKETQTGVPVFIYAFAPGQVEALGIPDAEVRDAREIIEQRFFS